MKILTPRRHGILDYVTVLLFLLAPMLLDLTGAAAVLALALAIVHFLLTKVTDFPMGRARFVPLGLHGMIELVVAVALVAAGFFWFGRETTAGVFYAVMGGVIFVVWLLSDYGHDRVEI